MKIFALQLDIRWMQQKVNFQRTREFLLSAQIPPGSLVLLPEMFATGFDVKDPLAADGHEHHLEKTGDFLRQLAQELQCTIQGSGVTESHSGKRQNIVSIFAPSGEHLASYQKIHPFSHGYEKVFFESGDTIVNYHWQDVSVCPFICYDLRFPEIFRHGVNHGAQIFTVVANWPRQRTAHWRTLLQSRAIENQAFVIGVNRTGKDPWLEYEGNSMIIAPDGSILAEADEQEQIISAQIDINHLHHLRDEFPVLEDRQSKWLCTGKEKTDKLY
jgi:predicted amidohydrolase